MQIILISRRKAALTPHFSVLTYDLLGHGKSAPPRGTPGLSMFSAQLLRLMDGCGIERAAVVGFSLGGMIARHFALDHPGRLAALAILPGLRHMALAEAPAAVGGPLSAFLREALETP